MKKVFIAILLILSLSLGLFGCSAMTPSGGNDYYVKDSFLNEEGGMNYEYGEIIENDFVNTLVNPDSTFSLDRNTASYSMMRKIINGGSKLPQNSVRIEELINYFNYDYERPQDGETLAMGGTLSKCPWNEKNHLFTVNVAAPEINFEDKKQNNLVFLIDTSGSMTGMDRLGLIQRAFTMLTENIDDNDVVSIVTYASGTRVAAEGMLGKERAQIANVLQDLQAGGSTNGSGGIQLAYETAQKYFIEGGNNRVILATDGDFNVGISNFNALKEFISQKRETGIWLSVLGVGMYNTNDEIMKTLAENGNGNYGYIDSVSEARKLLVEEMGGTLVTVAKDVKIKISFNAETVQEYRLIGYETKQITNEEFEDENKDAGEIGSGHTVTAVYELALTEVNGKIATGELRFKTPETNEQKSIVKTFDSEELLAAPLSEDTLFIGCVTEFGLLVTSSKYAAHSSFESVISRLEDLQCVTGENKDGFKAEFLDIVKKAKIIYAQ